VKLGDSGGREINLVLLSDGLDEVASESLLYFEVKRTSSKQQYSTSSDLFFGFSVENIVYEHYIENVFRSLIKLSHNRY
jgi:hypothetical protein